MVQESATPKSQKTNYGVLLVLLGFTFAGLYKMTDGFYSPPAPIQKESSVRNDVLDDWTITNLAQLRLNREGHRYSTGEIRRGNNSIIVEGYTRNLVRYKILFDGAGHFVALELSP
jgi:hypothetical protein